jgi:hypothetical protein
MVTLASAPVFACASVKSIWTSLFVAGTGSGLDEVCSAFGEHPAAARKTSDSTHKVVLTRNSNLREIIEYQWLPAVPSVR